MCPGGAIHGFSIRAFRGKVDMVTSGSYSRPGHQAERIIREGIWQNCYTNRYFDESTQHGERFSLQVQLRRRVQHALCSLSLRFKLDSTEIQSTLSGN